MTDIEEFDDGVIKIMNIDKYTIEYVDNNLLLHPKPITVDNKIIDLCDESEDFVDVEDFEDIDIGGSRILNCKIYKKDTIISSKNKFRSVLIDIWKSISTSKILQNTTFRIFNSQINKNGFKWKDELGFSFQSKDSNGTFKEILKMCNICNYNIDLRLELKDGKIINFNV